LKKASFGPLGQMAALLVVYVFVYLYHGASDAVLTWTLYNFAQVLVEIAAFKVARHSSLYRRFEVMCWSL